MERTWLKSVGFVLVVVACGRSTRTIEVPEGGGSGGTLGSAGADARAGRGGSPPQGKGGSGGRTAVGGGGGGANVGGTVELGGSSGEIGAGGTAGTAGAPGENCTVPGEGQLEGLSFQIFWQGALASEVPDPMVLHFTEGESTLEAIFGSERQAHRVALSERDSNEYGPSLWVGDSYTISVRTSGLNTTFVRIDTLELCVDAGGRELVGAGTLTVETEHDDYVDLEESTFQISGSRDATPPEWSSQESSNPLEFPFLYPSEPLATGSEAWLEGADGRVIPLVAIETAGTITAYQVGEILPLAAAYPAKAMAKDLLGLMFRGTRNLTTVADPGLQPLDGFESVLSAIVLSKSSLSNDEVALVTDERVIDGTRSLFIPAGVELLFHLARPEGSTRLSFDVRPIVEYVDNSASIEILAGIVGGPAVVSRTVQVDIPDGADDPGTAGAPGAGGAGSEGLPLERVELELLEPGADVLLSIETPLVEASSNSIMAATVDRLTFDAPASN
jgi:hypothetical protein